MQKNLGMVDQYLRLAAGTVALMGAAQCRRNRWAQTLLTLYGAMKVTEGVTGWCPIMYAMGVKHAPSDPMPQRAREAGRKHAPFQSHAANRDEVSAAEDTPEIETASINRSYQ
ncbi:hypothetical protein GCM10025857_05530 [Alicyclobacillus contaminans]|uniref:YgaP family membrane protein n=1 Tax=Alicyclobacillus contaminans TaxID=392016 RepID=UPI00041EA3C9|nr:DUF2892 domain-containing protein [Alicyclobacillus contaminans]GMA49196.1 hypothetical protein GCM10025857_05530 [Alicyclobacillus contaminans]